VIQRPSIFHSLFPRHLSTRHSKLHDFNWGELTPFSPGQYPDRKTPPEGSA
jgi:hypothetical protein